MNELKTAVDVTTATTAPPIDLSVAFTMAFDREALRVLTPDEVSNKKSKSYPWSDAINPPFGHFRGYVPVLLEVGWEKRRAAKDTTEAGKTLESLEASFQTALKTAARYSPSNANHDHNSAGNSHAKKIVGGASVDDLDEPITREHRHEIYRQHFRGQTELMIKLTQESIEPAKVIRKAARELLLKFALEEEKRCREEADKYGHTLIMSGKWRIAISGVIGLAGDHGLPKHDGYCSPLSLVRDLI